MKRVKHVLLSVLFLQITGNAVQAQSVTRADFERVDSINKLNDKVFGIMQNPTWFKTQNSFTYSVKEPGGTIYYLVNAENNTKKQLFSQTDLLDQLKVTLNKDERIGLQGQKNDTILVTVGKRGWNYVTGNNSFTEIENFNPSNTKNRSGDESEKRFVSPDNTTTAVLKDNNIWLKKGNAEVLTQLSFDGTDNNAYEWIIWSPDSKKIAATKYRKADIRKIPLIESTPTNQKQPIVHWRNYTKPGDQLPITLPALFDVESGTQVALNTHPYDNQFHLYLTGWNDDSSAFTFEFNERGHQLYQVVSVDALTGAFTPIISEKFNTFVHYGMNYRYNTKSGNIIWSSERDGWRHLYLFDGKTGEMQNQITKGDWIVRGVNHVDEKAQSLYIFTGGITPNEDPYNVHLCKVDFDGKNLKDLTPENGNHRVAFSTDRQYFIDTYSRPDAAPVSVLKKADGTVVSQIEKANITQLQKSGWTRPEVFVAKGRDGETDIWGTIYRPSNFNPKKKYPIVEYIYAGPHAAHVSKDFTAVHRVSKLADLGFIVVTIDGMGTAYRSKKFHDYCWRNLKDAGFPDRILWIKEAGSKYNYMDTNNVGIYGYSAGGQNTLSALLFHGDFYKAGVSFCGCHDNRMDKIWWNEQWMGYPLGPWYAESSGVDNAHLLKGKLLLINGELDDNVDPTSTLQVVDALIKANKDFEMIYAPGYGHGLGDDYMTRKYMDFFVRTLKNKQVDWNN